MCDDPSQADMSFNLDTRIGTVAIPHVGTYSSIMCVVSRTSQSGHAVREVHTLPTVGKVSVTD